MQDFRIARPITPYVGLTFGICLFIVGHEAAAQTLAPGSTITPTQQFLGVPGTLLNTMTTTTSSTGFGPDALTFTATSAVYETSAGTLDFYYQVMNSAKSTDSIGRFTTADFSGYSTSVFYQPNASNDAAGFTAGNRIPITVDRSGSGSVIGFNFDPPPIGNGKLFAGQTSDTMIIETNATSYVPGNFSVIDGVATTVEGFAPAPPPSSVPEPAALALLAPGLFGIIGFVRRQALSQA